MRNFYKSVCTQRIFIYTSVWHKESAALGGFMVSAVPRQVYVFNIAFTEHNVIKIYFLILPFSHGPY